MKHDGKLVDGVTIIDKLKDGIGSWEMLVKVEDEWRSVRCSGKDGYVYRYPTMVVAVLNARSCYPDACLLGGDGTVGVRHVKEPPNCGMDLHRFGNGVVQPVDKE